MQILLWELQHFITTQQEQIIRLLKLLRSSRMRLEVTIRALGPTISIRKYAGNSNTSVGSYALQINSTGNNNTGYRNIGIEE